MTPYVGTPATDLASRLGHKEPGLLRRSVIVVFDHHVAVMMVLGDGAGDNDGIGTVVPAAMIVERNGTVMTTMQALAVLVDDLDAVVVSMVGPDDDIGFGGRSYGRRPDGKRQSAHDD